MSAASVMAAGRGAAERLMQDTCTIRRVVSESTDPGSGVVTPTYSTVYSGKCRVQQAGAASRVEAGQASLLMLPFQVQVPMSVTGVQAEDQVVITASLDPDLVGRVFVVKDLAHKTHATARRLGAVERTS